MANKRTLIAAGIFEVLLDGTTRTVRSALIQSEDAITNCGGFLSCWCAH